MQYVRGSTSKSSGEPEWQELVADVLKSLIQAATSEVGGGLGCRVDESALSFGNHLFPGISGSGAACCLSENCQKNSLYYFLRTGCPECCS